MSPVTAATLRPLLTRQRFQRWLEQRQGRVGTSASDGACPLARYLQDATGVKGILVTWDHVRTPRMPYKRIATLPGWARTFTRRVDLLVPRGRAVSAPRALALLKMRKGWE